MVMEKPNRAVSYHHPAAGDRVKKPQSKVTRLQSVSTSFYPFQWLSKTDSKLDPYNQNRAVSENEGLNRYDKEEFRFNSPVVLPAQRSSSPLKDSANSQSIFNETLLSVTDSPANNLINKKLKLDSSLSSPLISLGSNGYSTTPLAEPSFTNPTPPLNPPKLPPRKLTALTGSSILVDNKNASKSLFHEVTSGMDENESIKSNSHNSIENNSMKSNSIKSNSLKEIKLITTKSNKRFYIVSTVLFLIIVILIGALVPAIFFSIKGNSLSTKNFINSLNPITRNEFFQSLHMIPNNTNGSPKNESLALKQTTNYDKRISNSIELEGAKLNGYNTFSGINPVYQNDRQIKNLMEQNLNGTLFYGLAYSPQNAMEPNCGLTQQDVLYDLALLSTTTTRLKTYGTQCNQAYYVLLAIEQLHLNMSLSLGVWIGDNDFINNKQLNEMQKLLSEFPESYFNSIYIGNEVLFRKDKSIDELLSYINDTKLFLKKINKPNIPIGTSEIGSLINHKLIDNCDVIGANIHPFFGGEDVSKSINWTYDFLKYQIEPQLKKVRQKPKIIITEVGWPFKGGSFQKSVANSKSFQYFLNNFICEAYQKDYGWYYFEAFDEPWKKIFYEDSNSWETEWGVFNYDRSVKEKIQFPACN